MTNRIVLQQLAEESSPVNSSIILWPMDNSKLEVRNRVVMKGKASFLPYVQRTYNTRTQLDSNRGQDER